MPPGSAHPSSQVPQGFQGPAHPQEEAYTPLLKFKVTAGRLLISHQSHCWPASLPSPRPPHLLSPNPPRLMQRGTPSLGHMLPTGLSSSTLYSQKLSGSLENKSSVSEHSAGPEGAGKVGTVTRGEARGRGQVPKRHLALRAGRGGLGYVFSFKP